MFPLGTVLLPGMPLPLHVFEPRYRQLVHDCLAADGEFGVALIERGSEVGGGDLRTSAGTVAHIEEAERLDDGRWFVIAVGVRRVRVGEWLPDDPYPRAEVADWPDPPDDADEPDPDVIEALTARLRRVLALRTELGEAVAPLTIELDRDPVLATWQAAALAGLGPMDLQAVLTTEGTGRRLGAIAELLADAEDLLQARIAG
jgi:Lon protease-like protein